VVKTARRRLRASHQVGGRASRVRAGAKAVPRERGIGRQPKNVIIGYDLVG